MLLAERIRLLQAQLDASEGLEYRDLAEWRERTVTVLDLVLPPGHRARHNFIFLKFTPRGYFGDASVYPKALQAGLSNARAILKPAIFELEQGGVSDFDAETALDGELWTKVNHLVEDERWHEVVAQACIFFEHWVRQRAALPKTVIGSDLMTAAFKGGPLALATDVPAGSSVARFLLSSTWGDWLAIASVLGVFRLRLGDANVASRTDPQRRSMRPHESPHNRDGHPVSSRPST